MVVRLALKCLLRDEQLDIDQRPLGVCRLRAVGVLRQVKLECFGGLWKLLLAQQDLADHELSPHAEPRLLCGGLWCSGSRGLLCHQGPERGQGRFTLPACLLGCGNIIRSLHGQRVCRVRLQKPLECGGAQVQACVVAWVREPVGSADLKEGMSAETLCLWGVDFFQVAGEIVPGEPGRQRLAGRELGLSQLKANGRTISPLGVLFEIGLEIFDGPAWVAAFEAGVTHGL